MYNIRKKRNGDIQEELNRLNINTKQYLKVCEDRIINFLDIIHPTVFYLFKTLIWR